MHFAGSESAVVEMQLVRTVLSAFRRRAVNIHQSLVEVVVSVQCNQRV